MSQFLKTPDDFWVADHLYSYLSSYVCPELVKFIETPNPGDFINDGGEELIQNTLDNSNHKLRMYGSTQELIENVRIFINHPEASRMLHDKTAPFYSSPVIYYSLNNEPYILKSDLAVILQNIVVRNLPELLRMTDNPKLIMPTTLRHQLGSVQGVEFVKFEQKLFDEIEKELQEGFKKAEEFDSGYFIMDLVTRNYQSIIAKLTSMNSVIWPEHTKRRFVDQMFPGFEWNRPHPAPETFSGAGPHQIMFTSSLFISSKCANCIENAIHKRPEVFKSTTPLPTVRVFEDGDQRFVICPELHNALMAEVASLNDCAVGTYSLQEATDYCNKENHHVEFIRTPILRAKHRAVPIPMGGGNFGILAADMFFEFFRNLIFGHKAFQKRKSEFLQQIKEFDIFFDYENKDFYFLNTDIARSLDGAAKDALKSVEKMSAKEVRNAKKDGFTVQHLKNELAHLGLLNAFPEIQNHAEIVYSEVDKRKKEKVLRTCDLFDAIEHCQLICILFRLPKIRKFLHSQKGCHRVYGYKCEQCEKEKKEVEKTLELQKPSEPAQIKEDEQKTLELQNSSRIKNLERELAEMKLHLEKVLMENQKLQSENKKLSVENDRKSIASTKPSKIKILDSNPDTVLACTSNRIQCLICDCHVDSSIKDDVIRCPLCKRRFHKKCAFEWLKEHRQCPACNGDLPKIECH